MVLSPENNVTLQKDGPSSAKARKKKQSQKKGSPSTQPKKCNSWWEFSRYFKSYFQNFSASRSEVQLKKRPEKSTDYSHSSGTASAPPSPELSEAAATKEIFINLDSSESEDESTETQLAAVTSYVNEVLGIF